MSVISKIIATDTVILFTTIGNDFSFATFKSESFGSFKRNLNNEGPVSRQALLR